MGIQISTGGAGAQFGGGLGAGFAGGVDDALQAKQAKLVTDEKRAYEDRVRAEAQLNSDKRIDSARQADRANVLDQRQYAEGLTAGVKLEEQGQARQMFDTRMNGIFAEHEPREGEPMSKEQRDYAELKMQAMQGYRPDMNLASVSDLLYNAEKGAQGLSEAQDQQDMANSIGALTAPDENGVPLASEQELAQLDALMQAGDPVQFQSGIAEVIGSYERRAAREGTFQGVAGMVSGAIETWNAAPMPVNVYGEGDEKTYSQWRNMQQGHILAAVKKEELFRNIMGENYDPFAGQDRITELLQQVDPVTSRLVRERDEQVRLAALTSEERIAAEAGFLEKSESADDFKDRAKAVGSGTSKPLTGDPKADAPSLAKEMQARINAGDTAGARKILAQIHSLTKPK